jgi:hypothetical protein
MKTVLTILITLSVLQAFSQKLDSLFAERKLPKGLTVTIKKDSFTFPDFPKPYIAIITFKSGTSSVYFFVYEYQPSDGHAFESAQESYWMVSGCNITHHPDFDKNFTTFVKQGYFFLLQRCACRTRDNPDCAELAQKINAWRK